MPENLQTLTNEIKALEQNILPLLQKQSEEIERHGTTATETRKALSSLEEKYDERLKDLDAARAELAELKKDFGTAQAPGATNRAAQSAGEAFVNSDEFKNADLGNGFVNPVNIDTKTLHTGATLGNLAGYVGATQRLPGLDREPRPDMHIRDLLPVASTDAASIVYVQRTGARWIAGVQAAEGDEKLEQALTFAQKQANPVTIAHWLPITRQALTRAPQLRAYIDGELLLGLKLAEDVQLLYGDGSAGNVEGLMTNTNVQDYDASGRRTGADTIIDTVRRASTLLRLEYFRATGLVVHPNDWEAIELQKDDEARYIWVTVTDGGVPRLWRIPVIDTPAINENEFLMGDFRIGAHLWDAYTARVDVGYVNDDFVKNRLALRGEEDIIFTTELPRAFVKGSFDAEEGGGD